VEAARELTGEERRERNDQLRTEWQLLRFIRGVAYPDTWMQDQPVFVFTEEEWDGR